MAEQWRLILPVKGGPAAKSRLIVPGTVDREALAIAMTLDALAAVVGCAGVTAAYVVTGDPEAAAAATPAGARIVDDPGGGLSPAIRAGIDAIRAELEDGPTAVLLPDLPALRAEDLQSALTACEAHPAAYVPDAEGTGTVLLAARRIGDLHPSFGDGSAARHDEHAQRLELDLPRLRRDVDVADALSQALALGVGTWTRAALRPGPGAG